jgi:carboxymethylenebutenolidase
MTSVQDVHVPLTDGSALPAALALPDPAPRAGVGDVSGASDPTRPGVLVIHEAIGLTDDIRGIAADFADAGYVALAPDFLAGLGPMPFCIARFARGIGRVRTGRPYRQLSAAQEWLGARNDVDAGRIGVAGFCMGGGFALLYAAGADVDVVAPFYAAVPKDDTALAGVCPVVASYGARDRIFGSGGPRLAGMLDRLGVEHDIATYPDAGHSFANQHRGGLARLEAILPTHGGYAPDAAADAWRRTLAFFDRHLGALQDLVDG